MSNLKIHAFRLRPGQDLRGKIMDYAKANHITAGFIMTCVGGLNKAVLRMANATPEHQVVKNYDQKLEIVSLVGTVTADDCHLHISLSDESGDVIGGHLKEGSIVAFTAEVVLGEITTVRFDREPDQDTGFTELTIKPL